MTSRREVLKGLIITVGGASLLSACNGLPTVVSTTSGTGRFYSQRELALISRLSDMFFPRTETAGALDVNVPGFMDGLMMDWANAATRTEHRNRLVQVDEQLNQAAAGDFLALSNSAAESALREFDTAAFANDDNDSFSDYKSLKVQINQAYFASEEGAADELGYVAVPGRWDPSVPIQA